MEKVENVLKRVYDPRRLSLAWKQVRKNAGAAGIDKMTVEIFADRAGDYLDLIHEKLKTGRYRFKPARRVLIAKEGSSSKKRKLGIPVIMDRIVNQSLNLAFMDIFDRDFSASNFGFRRGRSQHRAIGWVRAKASEGHEWCSSIDLKSFFDEIPHDLILKLIRRKIRDERVITLIARALKAGVIVERRLEKTTKGCPQGSPLSPMLANIVLDELDQELERRGHRFCRWADDFIILTRSERSAYRAMENLTRFLEEKLKLPVNREKSQVSRLKEVGFLGFQILRSKIRISTKARRKFKDKVRELTKRNNPLSMVQVIQSLNEYLRGWVAYFRIQEFRKVMGELDGFIRSRLRSMQLKKWKTPGKFQRMMIRAGFSPNKARRTWVRMRNWQSVSRPEVRFTLNLKWFRRQRLVSLNDSVNQTLELNFNH